MTVETNKPRPWWASLGMKLFASYVVVVGIGIGVLVVAASLATPSFFDLRMAQMMGNPNPGRGQGAGPGFGMMGQAAVVAGNAQAANQLDAALADTFRASLGQGLLVAGAAAVATAVGASLLVSRRIVSPIRILAHASHRIADGQYSERVAATGSDELGELGASFNAMAVALEATEQRRTELIGDVAHELRTPLATLRGYLEGLIDGVVEPSDQTWTRLHDETGRMQRLIDDLQELSRAEARQLALHPRRLQPAELVRSAVERLGPAYADKGVTLETNVQPGVRDVVADHDRAIQVLTNLLGNALRYTPAAGHVRVQVASSRHDDVAVAVSDTGVGIPSEHLSRVFERFYRVDKSRSRAMGGSGIGLTIARALVETMGGRIWVDSPGANQGTTFTFTLPAAA
jgi:two-component system sensor histidine kinase BaeS